MPETQVLHGQGEREIQKSGTKERYMSEPNHAAAPGAVATQPALSMKKQPYPGARNEPDQNREPGNLKINVAHHVPVNQ
jgi:hypothetical protein